ncbi:MAG: carbohydrate ABC transporter permease [Chloroflexota bacterium]|jgi:multiple sugar transport system permease protein|nr:carbohydrate ABC transporter permease [Chloroflexota bacterium]
MNTLFKKKSSFGVSPIGAVLSYLILGFWAFLILFPLYWIAITSFKEPDAVNNGPFYIPFVDFEPSLHAWKYIFGTEGTGTITKFTNTVGVSLISTFVAVSLGTLAAYALSRYTYNPKVGTVWTFVGCMGLAIALGAMGIGWMLAIAVALVLFIISLLTLSRRVFKKSLDNGNIAFWLISQRIMPPIASVIPIYFFFQAAQNAFKDAGLEIKLIDTWFALILSYVAANLPIVVWLMRDYFDGIPKELEESAAIDGANRYVTFFQVVLPLVVPGLVATFLFVLVFAWNEYLLALFLTNANSQTMPLFVSAQNATRGPQWWYLSVLVLIMIVPVIGIAIVLERYIARGLLVGAVKG